MILVEVGQNLITSLFLVLCAFTLQYSITPTVCWMSCRSNVVNQRFPPRFLSEHFFSFICSPVPFMISSHQNHTSGRCSPSVSHPLAVNVVRTHTGICMGFECCLIDWLKTHDSYRNLSTGNKILDILCLLYFSWSFFYKNSSV